MSVTFAEVREKKNEANTHRERKKTKVRQVEGKGTMTDQRQPVLF